MYKVIMLYTFVYEFYGVPRDLHSFPTRRSSDLRTVPHTLAPTGKRSAAVAHGSGASARRESPTRARTDRKSTRLNSSHVAISYAVFCLKKKTIRLITSSNRRVPLYGCIGAKCRT